MNLLCGSASESLLKKYEDNFEDLKIKHPNTIKKLESFPSKFAEELEYVCIACGKLHKFNEMMDKNDESLCDQNIKKTQSYRMFSTYFDSIKMNHF